MNIIRIKAFPDSKKPLVEESAPNVLRIFVREPAKDNQANRAVIKAVAQFYSLPENKLRLISGHRALNKMIEILK
jgi:hypothetical protein